MNTVAVIIVNWNSGKLLRNCLVALSNQLVSPQRVIVIDNASTDGSAENIPGYSNTTLIKMNSNLGFAAANNAGLEVCDCELVVLLNPDAFPEPEWLAALISAASAYPGCSAFGSRQMRYKKSGVLDGIGDCYHISGLIWRERHGHCQQEIDMVAREIFSPCAAAAMYRRKALIDLDGFDSDYFCYSEDVDLGFRLRLAGHKAMYVPNAVVQHVGSATTGGQHSDFSIYYGHRNLVWTFVKNMPSGLFWLLLPLHIFLNIATIFIFVMRGQGGVIFRAKLDALKGLPCAWAKRKKIQENRVVSIKDVWRVLDKRLIVG